MMDLGWGWQSFAPGDLVCPNQSIVHVYPIPYPEWIVGVRRGSNTAVRVNKSTVLLVVASRDCAAYRDINGAHRRTS